jgi:GNAT superfamily N-acetyltransferase
MSVEDFDRLPRHADYRWEYYDGALQICPRMHTHDAYLALRPPDDRPLPENDERARIRPLADTDWDEMVPVFGGAMADVPPFANLDEGDRKAAARDCLNYTRTGGDGALLVPACFVAVDERRDGDVIGGILITVLKERHRRHFDGVRSLVEPPPARTEPDLGQSHLCWIFVSRWSAGHGIGKSLLAASTRVLWDLGHRELATTFLRSNWSSVLWHWRNGFRLLPSYAALLRTQYRAERADGDEGRRPS